MCAQAEDVHAVEQAEPLKEQRKTMKTKGGWAKHRQTIQKTEKKNHRFETLQVGHCARLWLPVVSRIDVFFGFLVFSMVWRCLAQASLFFFGFVWFSRWFGSPSISEKQIRAQIRAQGHICSVSNQCFFCVFSMVWRCVAQPSEVSYILFGFLDVCGVRTQEITGH